MVKVDISIKVRTDTAPFWVNLFLYFFILKNITNLISFGSKEAFKYHDSWSFMDYPCAINYGNEFSSCFNNIYSEILNLKIEHQGSQATILDPDITLRMTCLCISAAIRVILFSYITSVYYHPQFYILWLIFIQNY